MSELTNPLLQKNQIKDYEEINEEFTKFQKSIEEIKKVLNQKGLDDNYVITGLTNQLENLKSHMTKINDKILFLKNFTKDDSINLRDNSSIFLLNKIKIISDSISKEYELVAKLFSEKISQAQNDLGKLEYSSQMSGQLQTLTKVDLERYKERELELSKIQKVTQQILELSRDMKKEADKQGQTVISIESYIEESQRNVNKGNEELTRKKSSSESNVTFYCWSAVILFVLVFFALLIVYYKYIKE